MVLRNECHNFNFQNIPQMEMSLLPRSLMIQGRNQAIKNLRGKKSYWEEDISVSLAGMRSILGFIQVGNLCLLNTSRPCFGHLVNTVRAAFTTGFVLCLELCSSNGHILQNHLLQLSPAYSRWHKEGNTALDPNALFESIFILHSILSLSISTHETLFSLPF